MKIFNSSNYELIELLENNGIKLVYNCRGENAISEEDAARIPGLVERLAPSALGDYAIEDKSYYAIIEHVNPYHAHLYRNGEQVVKYDMATPVEWIISLHESREEAQKALWNLALDYESRNDELRYEDDETIEDWRRSLEEDGITPDTDEWYKGEGIYYNNGAPMMLKDDTSFDYDVEMFRIDEI